jgi:membrane protease YdiL (CAAX protease family)
MLGETPVQKVIADRPATDIKKTPSVWLRVGCFVLLTYAISAPFEYLAISSGSMGAAGGLYALGGMWSPGIAAFLTAAIFRLRIASFGWRWGETRYQLWSMSIPFLYCLVGYGLVWLLGLGGLKADQVIPRLQYLPLGLTMTCLAALGEEIGWNGFLVPQLAREYRFTTVALTRGIVWSIWHYPMIIAGVYANQTPVWFNLICFTTMITGISFILTWLRLKSGSLWTGMFFHASHNWFIQAYFTRLTTATAITAYFIDEFGAILALLSIMLAYLFWRMRGSLPVGSRVL